MLNNNYLIVIIVKIYIKRLICKSDIREQIFEYQPINEDYLETNFRKDVCYSKHRNECKKILWAMTHPNHEIVKETGKKKIKCVNNIHIFYIK